MVASQRSKNSNNYSSCVDALLLPVVIRRNSAVVCHRSLSHNISSLTATKEQLVQGKMVSILRGSPTSETTLLVVMAKIPFLMACILSVASSFSPPGIPIARSTASKLKISTSHNLNLLTLHLSDENSNNEADDSPKSEGDDDDSDFPEWVRGLRQWPLYPSKTSSLQVKGEEERLAREVLEEPSIENRAADSASPLANLINVEALLMANGVEETMQNNPEDIAVFDLDSAKLLDTETANGTAAPPSFLTTPPSFLTNLQEFRDWNNVVYNLQKSVAGITETATETSSAALGSATELILKEATARLEYIVSEVSTAISPQTVQDLVLRAGRTLSINEGAANDLVEAAEKLAREQGLDVREAADRARDTTKSTAEFVNTANALLIAGYARKDTEENICVPEKDASPLFEGFESARLVAECDRKVAINKAAEMGSLCGAIYQDTVPRTHQLGHSIVANGTTANVLWMVTDSIEYEESFKRGGKKDKEPFLARTITIRGFDASDEGVDREELLNDICTASPESLGKGVLVHSGLLKLARAIYTDVIPYIDNTAPTHKILMNGHSVGGSLSILLLLLLVQDRGSDFVNDQVARVYSFGSPPIATTIDDPALEPTVAGYDVTSSSEESSEAEEQILDVEKEPYPSGSVLERFGLPTHIVYGYVQPWDPIARLFSEIDPLYPLLGDLGEDGKTLYASGPPRTLRPITRAIISAWEGWPRFRDNFRETVSQTYTSVGVQHVLLSEPVRYLSDRLVAVDVQIPPIDTVLRISSEELLPALTTIFPLDVFGISFVPTAIRSFIHHFYPAYSFPIVDYADSEQRRSVPPELNKSEKEDYVQKIKDIEKQLKPALRDDKDGESGDEAMSPLQWLPFPRK